MKNYNLLDIANWQLNENNENVSLPELQRGFVWKNTKIEVLWDSLFRDYPIGSFLLAKDADEHLYLLDGQQRATSIALGFYNPWNSENKEYKFWSLKKVPVLWIDLSPKEKYADQIYSFKLVTQSHPWGYQDNGVLSVSDRRNALNLFQENMENPREKGYTTYQLKNVFPYNSCLPVPLSFLINTVKNNDWQNELIKQCQEYLPMEGKFIKPKFLKGDYLEQVKKHIFSDKLDKSIIDAARNLVKIEIPCIVTKREVLESKEEQAGEEPTLFVRLNTQGTPLSGEELIYSMYKAAFPKSKELVERIGAGFLAPSVVISLVSRLVLAEIKDGSYPYSIGINEFREQLNKKRFKEKLIKLIGNENESPAKNLFQEVIDIILSKDDLNIPPVLAKELIKNSKELLLMVLQWLKINNIPKIKKEEKRKIFAAFTALSWFCRENTRYVREIWDEIKSEKFWSKQTLRKPFYHNNEYIMYPLIQPNLLRDFLLDKVVKNKILWDDLYTKDGDDINEQYKSILMKNLENNDERQELIDNIWGNFINKLIHNKSLLLFVQREYINDRFVDFNQLENLDDTNSPWDWDHIYPSSWVHQKQYVPGNVRHWTWTIGNLRALSLEDNRSESNLLSPSDRLADVKIRKNSFIEKNDWEYWDKIKDRIWDGQHKEIKIYLSAVINRLCNIYKEWYNVCNIGDLFNYNKV